MKPCRQCGCPVGNQLEFCESCKNSKTTLEQQPLPQSTETTQDSDAPTYATKFVIWSFIIFMVAIPIGGYLLGGIVIALIFGFFGIVIFAMLEKLAH